MYAAMWFGDYLGGGQADYLLREFPFRLQQDANVKSPSYQFEEMGMNRWLYAWLLVIPLVLGSWSSQAFGQGAATLEISFRDEVAPILAAKCLRCHGPEEAEADFRVDQRSSLEEYVEKGDVEGSHLWELINSTVEGERMPPDLGEHLTPDELSIMEQWIALGARFQKVDDWSTIRYKGTDLAEANTMGAAVWALLGRFHPALIHFPIALLTVAAFLAIFSFGNTHMEKAAIYCLVLGTLGSIAAAASGWGFAEYRKWPPAGFRVAPKQQMIEQAEQAAAQADQETGTDEAGEPTAQARDASSEGGREILSEEEREELGGKAKDPAEGMVNLDSWMPFEPTERNMHRWGGVAVAILGMVVTLLAMYVRNKPDRSQFVWKLASLVLAGLVGWVGHQGGEIHYGADLYDAPLQRINQLMKGETEETQQAPAAVPTDPDLMAESPDAEKANTDADKEQEDKKEQDDKKEESAKAEGDDPGNAEQTVDEGEQKSDDQSGDAAESEGDGEDQ